MNSNEWKHTRPSELVVLVRKRVAVRRRLIREAQHRYLWEQNNPRRSA